MESPKVFLLSLLLALVCSSEASNNTSTNSTERSGRKNVYSAPDDYAALKKPQSGSKTEAEKDPRQSDEDAENSFQPSDFGQYVPAGYYKSDPRPRYYTPNGPMYKSGTNVNWNVWKGDAPEPAEHKPPMPMPDAKGASLPPDFEEYFFPAETNYKGDPWTPEKMATMMMMMNQMQPSKSKLGGFFSGLTKEPVAILLAGAIPLSLILAAVLPTLMNMMMNGGLPTVTTTATGNKARIFEDELMSPVIKAVRTFGARVLENPGCMQRILCQATKGGKGETRSLQKALYKASTLVDEQFLRSFGVKDLFDSMSDGNCEKIPCSNLFGFSKNHSKKGKNLD